jgi:hypothetical protein
MVLLIEIRDEWLDEVNEAMGDDGSNDAEHDLLAEIADDIRQRKWPEQWTLLEKCEQIETMKLLVEQEVGKPYAEFIDGMRRLLEPVGGWGEITRPSPHYTDEVT